MRPAAPRGALRGRGRAGNQAHSSLPAQWRGRWDRRSRWRGQVVGGEGTVTRPHPTVQGCSAGGRAVGQSSAAVIVCAQTLCRKQRPLCCAAHPHEILPSLLNKACVPCVQPSLCQVARGSFFFHARTFEGFSATAGHVWCALWPRGLSGAAVWGLQPWLVVCTGGSWAAARAASQTDQTLMRVSWRRVRVPLGDQRAAKSDTGPTLDQSGDGTLAVPGHLLKMQILGPRPPSESAPAERVGHLCFHQPRASSAASSVRTPGPQQGFSNVDVHERHGRSRSRTRSLSGRLKRGQ